MIESTPQIGNDTIYGAVEPSFSSHRSLDRMHHPLHQTMHPTMHHSGIQRRIRER